MPPFRDWLRDSLYQEFIASAKAEEGAPPPAMTTKADRRGTKITRHWITSFLQLNFTFDYAQKPALLASQGVTSAVFDQMKPSPPRAPYRTKPQAQKSMSNR